MKRELNSDKTILSMVIPIYNEREGLSQLRSGIIQVINSWKEKGWKFQVEVILVNDGSDDGSREIMDRFVAEDNRFNVIHLSRNFGHQEAITAGISFANGSCVAILDGDLQDPPALVGDFLQRWASGMDIVYAVRKTRKERMVKRILYYSFYRLYKLLSKIDIPLNAGDFCLMDRKVVNVMNNLPEKSRFVRGLRSWAGFKQCGIEYDRNERRYGKPKYTFVKLVRLAFSGFFGFSTIPLRIATSLGFFSMATGFFLVIFMIIAHIFGISFFGNRPSDVAGFTSLFCALLIFAGFQLLALGIIGEYIGLLYFEIKNRPAYVIDSINGRLRSRRVPFGIGPMADASEKNTNYEDRKIA